MEPDLFGGVNVPAKRNDRGQIDNSIGKGNGTFLGHVANGMPRSEIERNWREGRYPDLHLPLAQDAMTQAGMTTSRRMG